MERGSTKEKLMETALTLFSQKGYEATSVDEIAESIGIKGPNLYKYFKGKQALFEEIATLNDVAYNNMMGLSDKVANSIHTGEELKAFSMKQIKFTISNDMVIKIRKMLTIEQFRSKKLCEQTTLHQYEIPKAVYVKLFTRMMEDGEIRKCDPDILAHEYVAPVTILIQLCDRSPQMKDEVLKKAEAFIDLFIEQNILK